MNRKQRRKLLRDGVNPKEVMDRYTKELYEQGFNDGIYHTADTIMILTAYCLHNHLGLGKKRLPEIMQWIGMNIDSFATGQLEPRDIQLIREELEKYNITFTREVNK